MALPTFVDLVKNERDFFAPLLVEKPTNRIRRDLFRGKLVGTDDLTSEHYGASAALVNQVCAEMERWGFQFERIKGADNKRGFKLTNPLHEPTVRTPRTPGPPRRRFIHPAQAAPAAEPSGRARGDLRREIRAALENGDAMSSKECMARFSCSEGNLRAVVRSMENDGFSFDVFPSKTGKTYAMRKGGTSRAVQKSSSSSNGNGRHGSNERLPLIAFPPGAQRPPSDDADIPPLPVFGERIQLVGQYINPDGSVSLMFRDDGGDSWLTTIEGHSVVEV